MIRVASILRRAINVHHRLGNALIEVYRRSGIDWPGTASKLGIPERDRHPNKSSELPEPDTRADPSMLPNCQRRTSTRCGARTRAT
jgi:hypothetical protein